MSERAFASPLVDTAWLEAHLADPDLRVFDCTTHLVPDPAKIFRVESGRADWTKGHVPGAGFLDVDGELSDRTSPLMFTLPPSGQFAAMMSAHGVGDGTRVVLYSAKSNIWLPAQHGGGRPVARAPGAAPGGRGDRGAAGPARGAPGGRAASRHGVAAPRWTAQVAWW